MDGSPELELQDGLNRLSSSVAPGFSCPRRFEMRAWHILANPWLTPVITLTFCRRSAENYAMSASEGVPGGTRSGRHAVYPSSLLVYLLVCLLL
jgi:hypothetical protein